MEYSLVRSRRRSISVSVGRSGLVVRSPVGAPKSLIERFLSENSDWIRRQTEKMADEDRRVSEHGLYTRSLPYMGRMVDFAVSQRRKREGVSLSGSAFEVFTRDPRPENISKIYSRWLRKEAKGAFEESISRHKGLVGAEPSSLSIRDQKTRWGSASHSGNLSLNFNLLKAPQEVLDYVVVHELCHLRVRGHSKKFWSLVESVMPDYRRAKKWLVQNRFLLKR
jgi:hypothetical protein